MHQTTRQIARETGIHHPSVYSIIHEDLQLKCLKKRRAHDTCTLVELAACFTRKSSSTQNRCGAKYNIYFVANFLGHFTAKNYENCQ